MKAIKFLYYLTLPLSGMVYNSCKNSNSENTIPPTEFVQVVWEDTAKPVILEFIHWYEDQGKIPLLREYENNKGLGLANVLEWGDSLKKCPFLTKAFIDSIIPAIEPHYEGSAMDYGYPISHVQFELKSNYPPANKEDDWYSLPFYGRDSIVQIKCVLQNDSTLRCAFSLGEPIQSNFVTWLIKTDGQWLIQQWDTCFSCLDK